MSHGRPHKNPGSTWALRESFWNATQRADRQKAALAQLRAACAEAERGLCGWRAICAWLNAHHFRNREGGLVTERVGKGWRQRLGMPVLRGRPGREGRWPFSAPWTSNYLLLAWAVSLYRSGGPELPRMVIDSGVETGMSDPVGSVGASLTLTPSSRA
jgi:hypothetical protein